MDHLYHSIRQMESNQKQMRERSGPMYETAKERSRILNDAWRAAGSPRHVIELHTPNGIAYGVKKVTGGFEYVSKEEWDAWRAWRSERYKLRKKLGYEK